MCDDDFNTTTSDAICKEMGYDGAIPGDKSWISHEEIKREENMWLIQDTFDIRLDNVRCSTSSWEDCSYSASSYNCGHDEDVFLACSFWPRRYCPESEVIMSIIEEGFFKCTSCPQDSYPIEEGLACACPIGYIWDKDNYDQGSCNPCPPGTYKHNETSNSCNFCPQGATSNAGSGHCICPAGQFWNFTTCQNCPEGTASQEGALECMECPTAAVSGIQRTRCRCSWGKEWVWEAAMEGSCEWILPTPIAMIMVAIAFAVSMTSLVLSICIVNRQARSETDFAVETGRLKLNRTAPPPFNPPNIQNLNIGIKEEEKALKSAIYDDVQPTYADETIYESVKNHRVPKLSVLR